MQVDLAPIVNQVVIPVLTPLLGAGALWVLNKAAKLLHVNIQAQQRVVLETAISNGIAYADQVLAAHETVQTSDRVAQALNYVLPKVPVAMKDLGVTPAQLGDLILARLPAPAPPYPAANVPVGTAAAPLRGA